MAPRSDLTTALRSLAASAEEHPQAVVVVSDGRLDDPAEDASKESLAALGKELKVPIHTIATTREGLPSVEIDTKAPHRAQYERSDVTAVPSCGVIGEAMLALVLADALLEKTGGDSMGEVRRNLDAVLAAQKGF